MKAVALIIGILIGLVGAFLLVRPNKGLPLTLASFVAVIVGVSCIVLGIL